MNDMETFVTMQSSPNTQRAYRQDLVAWNEFLDGREVSESTVVEFKDFLERTMSTASAVRRFSTVRSYYKWEMDTASPFRRVKAPRRISNWSPASPDESKIDALFRVCTRRRDRAILALLANGLRAQEICDLGPDSYYWDETYETYILRVIGKGMKMRLVPASEETILEMEGIVLPFAGLNIRKIYYAVKRWSAEAGIEGLHPHMLRHGYATRMVRAKVSVFALQRLLGHADPRTTGQYVNLDLSDLVAAAASDPRIGVDSEARPRIGPAELPRLRDGRVVIQDDNDHSRQAIYENEGDS